MNLASLATKNLSVPEINLLNKLETTYGINLSDDVKPTDMYVCTNPVSGQRTTTNPLIATLYKFTLISYISYERVGKMVYNGKNVAIGTYDRVRYLILKLDPKFYSEMVD